MTNAEDFDLVMGMRDVSFRLRADFGDQSDRACALLEPLFHLPGQQHPPVRLLRCALHLADGNLDALVSAVQLGRSDYRDLILAAEYNPAGHRVRNFNQPFEHFADVAI